MGIVQEVNSFAIINASSDNVTATLSWYSDGDVYLAPNSVGVYSLTDDQINTRQRATLTNSFGTSTIALGSIIADGYSYLSITDDANGQIIYNGDQQLDFGKPISMTSGDSSQSFYSFLTMSFTPTYFAKFNATLSSGSGSGIFSQINTSMYLIGTNITPGDLGTSIQNYEDNLQDSSEEQEKLIKAASKGLMVFLGLVVLLIIGAIIIFIGLIYYKKHKNVSHT